MSTQNTGRRDFPLEQPVGGGKLMTADELLLWLHKEWDEGRMPSELAMTNDQIDNLKTNFRPWMQHTGETFMGIPIRPVDRQREIQCKTRTTI